jgi:hypothetical protein
MMTRHSLLQPLRWLAAVWLAWVALAGVAFAGYDARRAELRDKLATTQEITGQNERRLLTEAIDKYIASRNEILQRLVAVVEESSDNYTQQEQKWREQISTLRADLAVDIGDSLHDQPAPSLPALVFRQTVLSEEDKFINGLTDIKVADARDQIILNRKNVAELKKNLEEKWRSLREQDQSLDDNEKQAVEELKGLVDEAINRVASERRELKDKVARIVNNATKFPRPDGLLPEWADIFLQLVEQGTDQWLEARNDFEARVQKYQGWVAGERGGILVLFKSMRDLTQDFVDKNKFELMKKRYEEARGKLDSWRSASATSGQRRDADDFAGDVLTKLSVHLAADEAVFNELVRAHEHRFFGPISPDVREELVETKIWEDRIKSVTGRDLETRLREWRNDTDNLWYVDMSPLTSEMRDYLRGFFKERVHKIVEAEQSLENYNEKLKGYFDRKVLDDDLK